VEKRIKLAPNRLIELGECYAPEGKKKKNTPLPSKEGETCIAFLRKGLDQLVAANKIETKKSGVALAGRGKKTGRKLLGGSVKRRKGSPLQSLSGEVNVTRERKSKWPLPVRKRERRR